MTTWYLTKYSLTHGGIEELDESDGWHIYESDRDGTSYLTKRSGTSGFYQIGKDVFSDRGTAVFAAEKARDRKITSVLKQLKKLREMRFEA